MDEMYAVRRLLPCCGITTLSSNETGLVDLGEEKPRSGKLCATAATDSL